MKLTVPQLKSETIHNGIETESAIADRVRRHVIEAVRETACQHGALKAIVFGSFARNTATRHSDVDAVFIENTNRRFIDRLDRYMRDVYNRTGLATDVLVYTPKEFLAISNRPFIQRILKEGIVAYER